MEILDTGSFMFRGEEKGATPHYLGILRWGHCSLRHSGVSSLCRSSEKPWVAAQRTGAEGSRENEPKLVLWAGWTGLGWVHRLGKQTKGAPKSLERLPQKAGEVTWSLVTSHTLLEELQVGSWAQRWPEKDPQREEKNPDSTGAQYFSLLNRIGPRSSCSPCKSQYSSENCWEGDRFYSRDGPEQMEELLCSKPCLRKLRGIKGFYR